MTFTSYAQNFEDVMLWRALRHIHQGCYVDIGAQHPMIDSVSLAFYECGWRGVHVEPVPMYASLLRQHRPDEVVLQIALGDVNGSATLRMIPETGLSTIVSEYADYVLRSRGLQSQPLDVDMRVMRDALSFLNDKELHWMKIDVEGFERQVLNGWDPTRLRPWILVIESELPGGGGASHESWEPLVRAANYELVYVDGLNRFYCAKEHHELAAAFAVPPNVADAIRLTRYSAMLADVNAAHERERRELIASHDELAAFRAREMQRLSGMNRNLKGVIESLQSSRSWRLTAPLRCAADFFRKLRRASREGRLLVALTTRLRRVFPNKSETAAAHTAALAPLTAEDLSPNALSIYQSLMSARGKGLSSLPET